MNKKLAVGIFCIVVFVFAMFTIVSLNSQLIESRAEVERLGKHYCRTTENAIYGCRSSFKDPEPKDASLIPEDANLHSTLPYQIGIDCPRLKSYPFEKTEIYFNSVNTCNLFFGIDWQKAVGK